MRLMAGWMGSSAAGGLQGRSLWVSLGADLQPPAPRSCPWRDACAFGYRLMPRASPRLCSCPASLGARPEAEQLSVRVLCAVLPVS